MPDVAGLTKYIKDEIGKGTSVVDGISRSLQMHMLNL